MPVPPLDPNQLSPDALNTLLQQVSQTGQEIGSGAETTVKGLGDWVVKTLRPDFHVPRNWGQANLPLTEQARLNSAAHQMAPIENTLSQASKGNQLRFVPPTRVVPPGEGGSTLTRVIQPMIRQAMQRTSVGPVPKEEALTFNRRMRISEAMAKLAAQKGITLRDLGHNIMVGRLPGSKALRALLADIGSIEPSIALQMIPQNLLNQMLQTIQGPQG